MTRKALSFIVPFHNESTTLEELTKQITAAAAGAGADHEIIFVDDGSTDDGLSVIRGLAKRDPRIKALSFQRNFGQTAALSAGIHASSKEILIALDADLQNDPADVSRLLQKLDEGYDVVSGWRKDRKDSFIRRLPSQCANALISRVTGVRLHDYGCSLKAYRREYLADVPLYGEMHRFIPVFAAWYGARVTEIPVNHRPRIHGRSHYAVIGRSLRVLFDLITVKFLHTYVARPMHFFGSIATVLMSLGCLSGLLAVVLRITGIRAFVDTPLPLATVFFITIGVVSLLMGLIAELLIRIYFEQHGGHAYRVYATINLDDPNIKRDAAGAGSRAS